MDNYNVNNQNNDGGAGEGGEEKVGKSMCNGTYFYDSDAVRNFSLDEAYISEASRVVSSNKNTVGEFWKIKHEKEAAKNWDKFYKRNTTNFFKDRRWMQKEFPELHENPSANLLNLPLHSPPPSPSSPSTHSSLSSPFPDSSLHMPTAASPPPLPPPHCYKTNNVNIESSNEEMGGKVNKKEEKTDKFNKTCLLARHLMEIGCGVGNALVPILSDNPAIRATGIDCSRRAIEFLNERWKKTEEENRRSGKNETREEEEKEKKVAKTKEEEEEETKEKERKEENQEENKRIDEEEKEGTPSVCSSSFSLKNMQPKDETDMCSFYSQQVNQKEEKEKSVRKNKEEVEEEEKKQEKEKIMKDEKIQVNQIGERLKTAVWDITTEGEVPSEICEEGSVDAVLFLFVLSAIHRKLHVEVLQKCTKLLKEGGMIILRDYGRYDMAQLRFALNGKSKIEENMYVRYDGTYAYYFSLGELRELLCHQLGLQEIENRYVLREMTNRKTGVKMKRIWVQAKFQKIETAKLSAICSMNLEKMLSGEKKEEKKENDDEDYVK